MQTNITDTHTEPERGQRQPRLSNRTRDFFEADENKIKPKKTKIKINWHKIFLFIDYLFVCAAIFLLPGSIFIITSGWHNQDTGHNLRYLEEKFDTELQDMGSDSIAREPEFWVIIGHKQMVTGVWLLMIASIIIGGHLTTFFREEMK